MRIAPVAMLAAFLAGATFVTAEADELRLDADQLDRVSAGMTMSRGITLQQIPALIDAYGYGDAFSNVEFGSTLGDLGGSIGTVRGIGRGLGGRFGGAFAGIGLPLGMSMTR